MSRFRQQILFLLLVVLISPATAQIVQRPDANLTFELPDRWTSPMIRRSANFVEWNAPPITEKSGRVVVPGLNIVVHDKGPEPNAIMGFTGILFEKMGYRVNKYLSDEKLELSSWFAYRVERVSDAAKFRTIIVTMLNEKGQYVMATLTATDETYPTMESEFMAIMRSMKVLKSDAISTNQYDDGLKSAMSKDFKTALNIWRPLAMSGDVNAQVGLGRMYLYGEGVKQDYKEAAQWFQKAGEQGNAVALYTLGLMHSKGDGVNKSSEEAARWIHKAAQQGHPPALSALGLMYGRGDGVKANAVVAYAMFLLASARGDEEGKKYSDELPKKMTDAQVTKGRELAANWKHGMPLPISY